MDYSLFFRRPCQGVLLAMGLLAAQPLPAATSAPVDVHIKTLPGLRYSRVRFVVAPGAAVHLSLKNTDTMLHNLVIVKPGTRIQVVQAALLMGAAGPQQGYVPHSAQVLFAIPALNAGQQKTLDFQAPRQPGVYPYVCTFPGHGFIMYGAMYVQNHPDLPPLASDPNVPHIGVVEAAAAKSPHAYRLTPPAMYRIFMPEASPAAIAVWLPGGQSYCWDAARCRLRYIWSGGFIDPMPHWVSNGSRRPKILGKIYYRATAGFPLRFGGADEVPKVDWLGYRLLNGYPEFHYRANRVEIRQLITTSADGGGVNERFHLAGNHEAVWFIPTPQKGVAFEASTGSWEGGRLVLTDKQARQFTVTISHKGAQP